MFHSSFLKTALLSLLWFSFLLASRNLQADEIELRFDIRGAAYFPSGDFIKKHFGNAHACFQLEASVRFMENFALWSNLDWLSRRGDRYHFKKPVPSEILIFPINKFRRLSIANWSIGLNYIYDVDEKWTVYTGLGPCFGKVWLNKKGGLATQGKSKLAVGAVFKLGFYWAITEVIFIDFFIDYLYQTVRFNKHINKKSINLSGFKPGLGIGMNF